MIEEIEKIKIAWFTPFSQKSAIGKYSRSVTRELSKYCHVDLWLSENEDLLATNLPTVFYKGTDDVADRLRGYEHVVYNMGNYVSFHKDIYEMSRKVPGIVILHDLVMHHFFTGYYCLEKRDTASYVEDMKKIYGEEAGHAARGSLSGARPPIWESDEVVKYPLFERVIEGALGVITHSAFHDNIVNKKYLGPTAVIPHPCDSDETPPTVRKAEKAHLGLPGDKILLVTIGHVNPNKRIDRILHVLSNNPKIAERLTYLVIGLCENGPYYEILQDLVRRHALSRTVRFLGFKPDAELHSYMAAAEGFINLRFPAMEGASWSLIEELHFGKPVIVTDTGCYSELPDDCVFKVRPDHEEHDIREALIKIVQGGNQAGEIGERGKKFAMDTFSSSQYCELFTGFLAEVSSWKPILGLIDRVASELLMMGVPDYFPVVDNTSNEIYSLYK